MKAMRVILAVIAVIALFAAEALTMGLFALDKAVSEESVREALEKSDVVAQMVEEALAEETVNMGGEYGEMMGAVLQSNAVNDFMSAFVSSAVNTQLFGDSYEEIANDELLMAFSEGIDEVNESGAYEISPMEGELLRKAMQQELPDLTATLNEQMEGYAALEGVYSDQAVNEITGAPFSSAVMETMGVIACLLLAAAVVALCWRSRLGFLWCAITMAVVSMVYCAMAVALGAMTSVSAADTMIFIMTKKGFETVWMPGLIIAVVFFAAFIVLKILKLKGRQDTP